MKRGHSNVQEHQTQAWNELDKKVESRTSTACSSQM